jgi:hypothetical protein
MWQIQKLGKEFQRGFKNKFHALLVIQTSSNDFSKKMREIAECIVAFKY